MSDLREDKKISRRILLSALITLAVGFLLCGMITASESVAPDIFEYLSTALSTTETVWLLLGMMTVLALALIFFAVYSAQLLFSLWRGQRKKRKKKKSSGKKAKRTKSRFAMLSRVDKKMKRRKKYSYDNVSPEELCESFRNYAAGELGLYYSIEDVRRFVAGMGVSKIILLQGMSGTGKTSLAYAMGRFISNDSVIVPVQPMWRERSDMIGYYNEFTKRFNETTLLVKMYEANYKKEPYITVLDEVNISRIEYYFAEFLSLLEIPNASQRYLEVTSDTQKRDPKLFKDGKMLLPSNMWFVGTANNDDSTFAISDKVYDRAMVLNLDKRCEPFEAPEVRAVRISYGHWCNIIDQAIKSYSMTKECEEKIILLDSYLADRFRISFGNRIMKQLKTYIPIMIACGGTEEGAADDIISKKVLRKLSQQSPNYLRGETEPLKEFFDNTFGRESMPQCREFLALLEKSL